MLEYCLHSTNRVCKFPAMAADPCVFFQSESVDLAVIYIDDLIIVTKTQQVMKKSRVIHLDI